MLKLRGLVRVKTGAAERYLLPVCLTAQCYTASAPGKWKCACGLHNFDFHSECYSCHEKRTDTPTAKTVSPLSLLGDVQLEDGDSAEVHTSSTERDKVHFVEGVWICPACYTLNGPQRVACTYCREMRPLLQPRGAAGTPMDTHARRFGKVAVASSPPPTVSSSAVAAMTDFSSALSDDFVPQQPSKKGDWYCACGVHNFSRNIHCRKCHEPRTPSSSATPKVGLLVSRPGDWECLKCKMYNFSWRTVCKRCNEAQPLPNAAPFSAPPDSDVPTGMAAGWVCQACHSLNPADDAVLCVICGSPKRA
ncbi:putative Zn-finger in Ran binding protein [Leishmania utingensis]|uniref:Zn-finger in Ran binding protein n=1 Tax=Leishmania utingensis TaxID=653362 RepID=A0AAW3A1G6_9TRYP